MQGLYELVATDNAKRILDEHKTPINAFEELVTSGEWKFDHDADIRREHRVDVRLEYFYHQLSGNEHINQVDSHRTWLRAVYDRFSKYMPLVTETAIDNHDLSKYSVVQCIGYTAKFVHKLTESRCWPTALAHHYAKEPHHPEYYEKGTDMPPEYLQESVMDMIACRWERT